MINTPATVIPATVPPEVLLDLDEGVESLSGMEETRLECVGGGFSSWTLSDVRVDGVAPWYGGGESCVWREDWLSVFGGGESVDAFGAGEDSEGGLSDGWGGGFSPFGCGGEEPGSDGGEKSEPGGGGGGGEESEFGAGGEDPESDGGDELESGGSESGEGGENPESDGGDVLESGGGESGNGLGSEDGEGSGEFEPEGDELSDSGWFPLGGGGDVPGSWLPSDGGDVPESGEPWLPFPIFNPSNGFTESDILFFS